jgi:Uma2 family endonuclease
MSRPGREAAERRLTVAEFAALPEADAYRVELVRGRLVRSPRPMPLHARLVTRLGRALDEAAEEVGTGVVLTDPGVLLGRDPDTVRGPDLAFYLHEHIPESGYAAGFWGPPDLAVEITSPSNRAANVRAKVADYVDAGVRLVWVVDPPARSVTAYTAGGSVHTVRSGGVLEAGGLLPPFRLPLAAFFAV